MAKRILPNSAKALISDELAKVFERLKIRLLSPIYKPSIDLKEEVKRDKLLSLPGMYFSSYEQMSPETRPSMDALKKLAKLAEQYIDAQQEKLRARAVEEVERALQDASIKEDYNYEKELGEALYNVFDQAQGATKQVLETELQRVKTIGLQEGTLDLLERQGISDPTVAFLPKMDTYTCEHCKEMYLLPDLITPRVYKLSELKSGNFNKKDPSPHMAPLHPNCFLHADGRVLTEKGWKPLKYVAIGDKVLTHNMQYKKVINTLNWDMTPYRKDFYSIKMNIADEHGVFVTPDHQFWTDSGFKAIKDIDPTKDHLMKLVQNCVYCNKKTDVKSPKLFCQATCRDHFFSNVVEHVDKLESIKLETEYFKPTHHIWHHKQAEPAFLHDITVEGDESFNINGVFTKNCRCLMIVIYPGYTFNDKGDLEYANKDHDEHEHQRGFRKSLSEDLINHDCDLHRKGVF